LLLRMAESEGYCWRLGLTTVMFGVTFILSMGVVSVQYPHRPPPMGETVCGQPPEISEPLTFTYDRKTKMEITYSCPEDFRLEGPDKLICKKKTKKWVSEGSSGKSQCVAVDKSR